MISSVLKSSKAIDVNIAIMRAFFRLRAELSTRAEVMAKLKDIERAVAGHDEAIGLLFEALKQLMETDDTERKKIGFTAKETQAKYGGETMENFTPQAKKRWESIPADMRIRILNNVWCVNCTTTVGIGAVSGKIQKRMLVLEGTCTRCGGPVARVVEND